MWACGHTVASCGLKEDMEAASPNSFLCPDVGPGEEGAETQGSVPTGPAAEPAGAPPHPGTVPSKGIPDAVGSPLCRECPPGRAESHRAPRPGQGGLTQLSPAPSRLLDLDLLGPEELRWRRGSARHHVARFPFLCAREEDSVLLGIDLPTPLPPPGHGLKSEVSAKCS